jgi:hypothetical protein
MSDSRAPSSRITAGAALQLFRRAFRQRKWVEVASYLTLVVCLPLEWIGDQVLSWWYWPRAPKQKDPAEAPKKKENYYYYYDSDSTIKKQQERGAAARRQYK